MRSLRELSISSPDIQRWQCISMDFKQIWKCARACLCIYLIKRSASNPADAHPCTLIQKREWGQYENGSVHGALPVFPCALREPTWRAARTSSSSASHRTACWISWMSWWGWQAAVPSGHQRICPVRSSWTWPTITANQSTAFFTSQPRRANFYTEKQFAAKHIKHFFFFTKG